MNKVFPSHSASSQKTAHHYRTSNSGDLIIVNHHVYQVAAENKCLNVASKLISRISDTYQRDLLTTSDEKLTRPTETMNIWSDNSVRNRKIWTEIELEDLSDSSSAKSEDYSTEEGLLSKQKQSIDSNLQTIECFVFSDSKSNTCLDDQLSVQSNASCFHLKNLNPIEDRTLLVTDITGRTHLSSILLKDNFSINTTQSDISANDKAKCLYPTTHQKTSVSSSDSTRSDVTEQNNLFSSAANVTSTKNQPVMDYESGVSITGSLSIDVNLGMWTSDIKKKIDIQMGRDVWNTAISELSSDLSKVSWETNLSEIALTKATLEDWQTSIKNIKEDDLQHKWTSSFADGLQNTQSNDWHTEINKIENIQAHNSWATIVRPIEKYKPKSKEWTTKINPISKNTEKDSWKVQFPQRLKLLFSKDDWKTQIRSSSGSTKVDRWEYQQNDLKVEKHVSDWSTVLKKIEPSHKDSNRWISTLSTIEPIRDDNKWSIKLSDLENKQNQDDWRIKLTDIKKTGNESIEWSFAVNDVPTDVREINDWLTKVKPIDKVCPEDNMWSIVKNEILPKNVSEVDTWSSTFHDPDLTGILRDTWETNFFDVLINSSNEDWKSELNLTDGSNNTAFLQIN